MTQLYDEPIRTRTTASGSPAAFTWRGETMPVRQVLGVWQAAGDARLYRVGVTTAVGPAIVEIVDRPDSGWAIRHLWT
jgi:hypothetical protein